MSRQDDVVKRCMYKVMVPQNKEFRAVLIIGFNKEKVIWNTHCTCQQLLKETVSFHRHTQWQTYNPSKICF